MKGEFNLYELPYRVKAAVRSGFVLVVSCLGLISCQSSYTPKPRGYFRNDFPQKGYVTYSEAFSYSLEVPEYAVVRPYAGIYADDPDVENWLNVDFPDFSAHIHLTYKTVRNNLGELIDDAHTFAYKHAIKAEAINEIRFAFPEHRVYGVKYEIKGNTASGLQFFGTDSTRHFVRGALYFDNEPNKDSLAPVIRFLEMDIDQLIKSLEWKDARTNQF